MYSFLFQLNVTGWGVLNVYTNSSFTSDLQMRAAGYAEGAITQQRIYETSLTQNQIAFGNPVKIPTNFTNFMNTQRAWVVDQIKNRNSSDNPTAWR